MPHASNLLTAFARRDTLDKVMFGWVRGITRAFPNVSVAEALRAFAKEYGLAPEDFNLASQEQRYQRMQREFYEDQRTNAAQ